MADNPLEQTINRLLQEWRKLCVPEQSLQTIDPKAVEFYKSLLALPHECQTLVLELALDPFVKRGAEHVKIFMKLLERKEGSIYEIPVLTPRLPSYDGIPETHGSIVRGALLSQGVIETVSLADDPATYEKIEGLVVTPRKLGAFASNDGQPRCTIFAREINGIRLANPGEFPKYLSQHELEWVRGFYSRHS
ncbi:hypothetical protein HYU14_05965 [Candidatus Woesearchaeota archaeon]|nr:hypothetical protein [Candidatus Woesearchaeota archaeon]